MVFSVSGLSFYQQEKLGSNISLTEDQGSWFGKSATHWSLETLIGFFCLIHLVKVYSHLSYPSYSLFYTFFFENQVSWKEELCLETSGTLHPNILGILFNFLTMSWDIWGQSSKSYSLSRHFAQCILYIYTFFFGNQVSWKEEFCLGTSETMNPNSLGIFFRFFVSAKIF